MKVAMMQPDYIPWKGIFDLIHRVDKFVFYDDVQYTTRDWRNRNVVPSQSGAVWLTVPVLSKGKREQLIKDVVINPNQNWQKKHFRTLELTYAKAPFFSQYRYLLEDFYLSRRWENLSEFDIYTTCRICEILGIRTEFYKASDLNCSGSKDGEKVIKICKKLNCDYFINGPASKKFMNERQFDAADIQLDYIEYTYPEYRQMTRPFCHNVSVLDLLFNTGDDAPYYIWGWREK